MRDSVIKHQTIERLYLENNVISIRDIEDMQKAIK
jgi:hypothetical protein